MDIIRSRLNSVLDRLKTVDLLSILTEYDNPGFTREALYLTWDNDDTSFRIITLDEKYSKKLKASEKLENNDMNSLFTYRNMILYNFEHSRDFYVYIDNKLTDYLVKFPDILETSLAIVENRIFYVNSESTVTVCYIDIDDKTTVKEEVIESESEEDILPPAAIEKKFENVTYLGVKIIQKIDAPIENIYYLDEGKLLVRTFGKDEDKEWNYYTLFALPSKDPSEASKEAYQSISTFKIKKPTKFYVLYPSRIIVSYFEDDEYTTIIYKCDFTSDNSTDISEFKGTEIQRFDGKCGFVTMSGDFCLIRDKEHVLYSRNLALLERSSGYDKYYPIQKLIGGYTFVDLDNDSFTLEYEENKIDIYQKGPWGYRGVTKNISMIRSIPVNKRSLKMTNEKLKGIGLYNHLNKNLVGIVSKFM